MIFGLRVEKYKPDQIYQWHQDTNTYTSKPIKGRCTNCHHLLIVGNAIVVQEYRTKFGHRLHKYCPECSEKGMKELQQETKHLKLRAKLGWDHL